MEVFSVVYMSRAARQVTNDSLDRLLLSARANNAALGVTGVLLYGEGEFFQYFEGSSSAVEDVYGRIRRSTMHTHVMELEFQKITQRRFNKWFMGFRNVPSSVLQKLSHQQWNRERPWVEDHVATSSGMKQLIAFIGPINE